MDCGCGAGWSTRSLHALGFEVVGVDIAEQMLGRARTVDPQGDYRLVPDGDLRLLVGEAFDLVRVPCAAGLVVVTAHRPLRKESEPHALVAETSAAPWAIYVLGGT